LNKVLVDNFSVLLNDYFYKWERLGARLTSDQLLLPQSTFGQSRPARSVSTSIFFSKKKNYNKRFFVHLLE
jgi:hypothetical protein